MSINEADLIKSRANYAALTPVDFMRRSAEVYPDRLAVLHGKIRRTWSQTYRRASQLGHALRALGVGRGDVVTIMLANTPEMVESHVGVPVIGAVMNTLNTRLDAHSLTYMLDHAQPKVVLVDREFSRTMKEALLNARVRPIVIDIDDSEYDGAGELIGSQTYEALLAGAPDTPIVFEGDEWDAMSLNYTSGTTGEPKGVVYHHRGAYLNAVSNILEWDLPRTRSISGRCRCSIATGGAFRGRSRRAPVSMSACAASVPMESSTRLPTMALRITAARRSCTACWSMRLTSSRRRR